MASNQDRPLRLIQIATWSELPDRHPTYALVGEVDLVVVRYENQVSVLYGRCLHRGALLADGYVEGGNLICGVHQWDYRIDSGVSEYNDHEVLQKFTTWIDEGDDAVLVDANEIDAWALEHPQPYAREKYQGLYADIHGGPEEPYNHYIQELAKNGLSRVGSHGQVSSMGVPLTELPRWGDVQILTAQLARPPRLDDHPVGTRMVLGPDARKPLALDIPIFVSDMAFGTLSAEAKVALARGASLAGTGICSGEGGALPAEREAADHYLYELGTGMYGWDPANVVGASAFHFKAGQGAKTATGGHLSGDKVTPEIAAVRGLEPGQSSISPARFPGLTTPADFRALASEVRDATGGIPIGFKMSAQHVEADLDFVLAAGADYVILDGRGGGTGAAPDIFKANISIPLMAALPRARRHLDRAGRSNVTLIATGGLRTESDFVKAMALGADGVAIGNSALQAIGCLGMRACNTNNCPVGVATQDPRLRARLFVDTSARQLCNYLQATVELMRVLARACGHDSLADFRVEDLTSFKREIADLAGVRYAGVGPRS